MTDSGIAAGVSEMTDKIPNATEVASERVPAWPKECVECGANDRVEIQCKPFAEGAYLWFGAFIFCGRCANGRTHGFKSGITPHEAVDGAIADWNRRIPPQGEQPAPAEGERRDVVEVPRELMGRVYCELNNPPVSSTRLAELSKEIDAILKGGE